MPWEVFWQGREKGPHYQNDACVSTLWTEIVTTDVISLKRILRKDSFLIEFSRKWWNYYARIKFKYFGDDVLDGLLLREFLLGALIGLVQRKDEIKFLSIIHDFHLLNNIDTTINWNLFFSHLGNEDFRQ